MNKSFTLEEYKKNPSRLIWSHGKLPEIEESTLLFNDRHLCVRAGTTTWTYRIADVPASLALATEYEVRRARPYRCHSGIIYLAYQEELSNHYDWAGPEFEYKVEKP